jgi:hypothetical protein
MGPMAATQLSGQLSPQQLAHFEAFGFLHLRSRWSRDEVALLQSEAERLLTADRRAHSGVVGPGESQALNDVVEQSPVLMDMFLNDSSRVLQPLHQLLQRAGRRLLWTGSELNAGTVGEDVWRTPSRGELPAGYSEHGWHSDRPGVSETSFPRIKAFIYLVPTAASTGALRVIAGSHAAEFHRALLPLDKAHGISTADPQWAAATFGVDGDGMPGVAISSSPGDLILMHHSCYHGVYGHQARRAFFAMKFASSAPHRDSPAMKARPRGDAAADRELASLLRFSGEAPFNPHPVLAANPSPAVRALVMDAPSLAKAREAAARLPFEAEQLGLPGYVDQTQLMPFGRRDETYAPFTNPEKPAVGGTAEQEQQGGGGRAPKLGHNHSPDRVLPGPAPADAAEFERLRARAAELEGAAGAGGARRGSNRATNSTAQASL